MTRRTKAEMAAIKQAILDFATTEGPVTVRQTFYRLSNLGLIAKNEGEYGGTVSRVMVAMRESGELDWDLVEDATRYTRAPSMFDGPAQFLNEVRALYRRNIWATQPVAVEVWLEKEALAGIVMNETYPLGVGLYVNKGYGSATFIHDAARRIDKRTPTSGEIKHTRILYFGDWDPSGEDMTRDLHDRLERYTEMRVQTTYPDGRVEVALPFTVHRLALTPAIIAAHSLPSRPTKTSDSRSAGFVGDSTELDALPPLELRRMVREGIEVYIDSHALEAIEEAEAMEMEALDNLIKGFNPEAAA